MIEREVLRINTCSNSRLEVNIKISVHGTTPEHRSCFPSIWFFFLIDRPGQSSFGGFWKQPPEITAVRLKVCMFDIDHNIADLILRHFPNRFFLQDRNRSQCAAIKCTPKCFFLLQR